MILRSLQKYCCPADGQTEFNMLRCSLAQIPAHSFICASPSLPLKESSLHFFYLAFIYFFASGLFVQDVAAGLLPFLPHQFASISLSPSLRQVREVFLNLNKRIQGHAAFTIRL